MSVLATYAGFVPQDLALIVAAILAVGRTGLIGADAVMAVTNGQRGLNFIREIGRAASSAAQVVNSIISVFGIGKHIWQCHARLNSLGG
mmetsp:Transcript_22754/g.46327  ORF Transcript_22754/g.46327 Transcript_22754/m.46327 type:complete len:89 (-) Transcript_22754:134-400(-)